ncbi:hypothetical protein LZ32DRAFT_119341 [Colletotrichum eremochloae]|nr:hypothetical protein LZ32DRAFT_119341 [Colletotrichum eremochloae]
MTSACCLNDQRVCYPRLRLAAQLQIGLLEGHYISFKLFLKLPPHKRKALISGDEANVNTLAFHGLSRGGGRDGRLVLRTEAYGREVKSRGVFPRVLQSLGGVEFCGVVPRILPLKLRVRLFYR